MGVDLHNLGLLAHAQDLGARFTHTIGIGRQAVFVDAPDLERHRRMRGLPSLVEPPSPGSQMRYFEPLMKAWFAAQRVDSVDASPYEAATIVHDMNLPWPAAAEERDSYDAVLDFGCLEHVFDFPVAWRNCVDLCRVGGHVLHALPANNLAGHGFYQFSPELFFSLYRPERGFELRGVWMAEKADLRHWWKVADPRARRRRVTLRNSHETYLLVIAKKLAEVGPLPAPQQSDYAEREWLGASPEVATVGGPADQRTGLAAGLDALGLLDAARALRARVQALRTNSLALPAPDYERVVVGDLLRRGSAAP